MTEPLNVPALAKLVWADFVRARRALFVYEVLFRLGETWLFVPAAALALAAVLAGAGHVAVSNRDILDFLLSPLGLVYAGLLGTAAAVLRLAELAGVMVLAARTRAVAPAPVGLMLRAAVGKTARVARLGAVKLGLVALTFAPFVLLGVLAFGTFLSGHDINFYLADRPPRFWAAAGVGVALLASALTAGLVLYVRWAFALPILLFEEQHAGTALRASRDRVRGAGRRVGAVLLGWPLGVLLVGAGLHAGFRAVAAGVLERTGETTIVLVGLLAAQGGLVATVSFVAVVGQGLITRRLYLLRSEPPGLPSPAGPAADEPVPPWNWRLAALSTPLFLLAPVALWAEVSRYAAERPPVGITAHRGHARAAPENTLSAIRKAIGSRADYAEIDVQLTADGVPVLLHDADFMRVAGDPRRIGDLTLTEVRSLDVGSWFDPAFAGERVPTLAEVIDLARGRIKLNVELKGSGPDRRLARAVADLVRAREFEADALVTSFDADDLAEVRRVNPRLRTGLIVAHALGDVSRLEVDVLNVRADHLSDELLRAARRRGREVHVWTVNDPRPMARLMTRGVDNILTSDPDLGVRVRDDWEGRSAAERLLGASRLLLGLDP